MDMIAFPSGRTATVLGLPLHPVSLSRAADICESFCAERAADDSVRCKLVVTLNVEMAMAARRDKTLRAAIEDADLVVPDSVGVQWAAKVRDRVPGIDLLEAIVLRGAVRGARFFFLGAAPGVADRAAAALLDRYPGIVVAGTHHGYFSRDEEDSIIETIAASSPDYLFVGLGAGKQEVWLSRNRDRLGASVAIGVGGSFDVMSGNTDRAPDWFQQHGLEWLYRIATQPSRLGRALALPKFAVVVLAQKLTGAGGRRREPIKADQ